MAEIINTGDYSIFFEAVKKQIEGAQIDAARDVNRVKIKLYYALGKMIQETVTQFEWGSKMIFKLSDDLQRTYGGVMGFSPMNLKNMRLFYNEYVDHPQLLKLALNVPWGHNIHIRTKIKDPQVREYYLKATSDFGWTRNVLTNQIKANAYERHLVEKKHHNFEQTLAPYQAEQAAETLKSSYVLDFPGIGKPIKERELELRMIEKVKLLILELGYGF